MSDATNSSSLDSLVRHARRALVAGLVTGVALFAGTANAASAAVPADTTIYVYPFASDAGDVKLDNHGLASKLKTAMSGDTEAQQQAQDAIAAREEVADEIVAKLQSMGLRAVRADVAPPDDQNALEVVGSIDKIDAGNRRRRMLIGLGAGQSKVTATVQLVFKRAHGAPQLLEQFDARADSGHAPGVAETAGVGAVAGHAVSSLTVSGGLHAVSETKRAGVSSDEQRLGDAIAKQIGQSAQT